MPMTVLNGSRLRLEVNGHAPYTATSLCTNVHTFIYLYMYMERQHTHEAPAN